MKQRGYDGKRERESERETSPLKPPKHWASINLVFVSTIDVATRFLFNGARVVPMILMELWCQLIDKYSIFTIMVLIFVSYTC